MILFIAGIILSAFSEYILHRFYLHKPKNDHLTQHHTIFPGLGDNFSKHNAQAKDILSSHIYNAINQLPALIIVLITPATFSLLLGSITYTAWVEYSHLRYHQPRNTWLEKTLFFRSLKHHHKIHHVDWDKNYNIGSQSWDYIFRTAK